MSTMRKQKLGTLKPTRTERGIAAVEMAIAAPILIVLLLGIVEFGRYYNASISVTHAAREAVRKVALGDSAGASGAASTAANPVSVSVGSMVTCPVSGIGNASITLNSSFTFDALIVGLGTKTITRTAVMRCGG
jgi:Flp pilus assembly protein TadG